MNDRELLELAAKAAALPECGWMGPAFMYVKDNTFTDWNPLTDDGDALRLVVKLQIDIEWRGGEVWAYRHASADGECFTAIEATADHDPEIIGTGGRATRRAIVRAAAEIGKAMK
jgi:hypothetical protein